MIGPDGTARAERTARPPAARHAAAGAQCGLPEYQAVLRAAKRPRDPAHQRHHLDARAARPQQVERLHLRQLVPARHQRTKQVLCRGKPTAARETEAEPLRRRLQAAGRAPSVKAVRVNPGTVLVAGAPGRKRDRQGHQPHARTAGTCSTTTRCSTAPTSPTRSRASTKAPAARASRTSPSASPRTARQSSNESPRKSPTAARKRSCRASRKEAALQHFAVVLDGQLITAPSIDYTQYPEGIDASNGSQISGGFTITSAQNLANELQSGALPIKLELISQLAGLGDARQTGAQPGPDRGARRASLVVCLFLLALLPRARR